MAVPKSKQSKSRTNKRFANYKATAPVEERIEKICAANGVKTLDDLTKTQYEKIMKQQYGNSVLLFC